MASALTKLRRRRSFTKKRCHSRIDRSGVESVFTADAGRPVCARFRAARSPT
jgi:hypothetical protein